MKKFILVLAATLSATSYARSIPQAATLTDLVNDIKSFQVEQGDGRKAGTCTFHAIRNPSRITT